MTPCFISLNPVKKQGIHEILFLWWFLWKVVFLFSYLPEGAGVNYESVIIFHSTFWVWLFWVNIPITGSIFTGLPLFRETCSLWGLLSPQLHALKRRVDTRLAYSASSVPVERDTWFLFYLQTWWALGISNIAVFHGTTKS